MAHQKLEPNYTFTEEKLQALRQIVPEAFEDGKINFETLREALGDWVEDGEDERFGLTWPGKRDARRLAAIPSKGTLVPVYGDGLKADGTPDDDGHNDSRNIFIEGENLEVLKILHKSYAGRIKMIYIDPPYNTGNDFVYDDDFTEPLQHYLRRTGQVDDEGRALTTNKRADGRFHSKWLSMMYPRLKLARELLREDGVIFVSIDDNEVHNLKGVMNEVFGEENFIGVFCIKSTPNARDYGHIGKMHEYCLFYAKNSTETITYHLPERNKSFKFEDSRGPFNIHPLYNSNEAFHKGNRRNLYYPFYVNPEPSWDDIFHEISLENPGGWVEVFPPLSQKNSVQFVWRWGEEKARNNLNLEIIGYQTRDGEFRVVQKMRHDGKVIRSLLEGKDVTSRRGTAEVEELFGEKVFSFPKPSSLISRFIVASTEDEDIILDFFSGSGTTAQAMFHQNQLDQHNRRFILVQLPESNNDGDRSEYPTIADITKERLRRVALGVADKEKNEFFSESRLSFKSFRLQTGQLHQEWNGNVQELFQEKRDWHKDELLYELILTEGFPLDSTVNQDEAYQANTVRQVQSEFHGHQLLICLDDQIAEATIQQLDLSGDTVFVCFDHAITDQEKLRLSDKGLIKTIS
jgi:adenine-specific DNA-methyltransferase